MTATPGICSNCGAERLDRFCSRCGQNDRTYVRATREIVGDVLHETVGLDTRLARTLKSLLLRPGSLTIEWCRNRRADYVPPVRLYLVVSIVFFGALSLGTRFDVISYGPESQNAPVSLELDPEYDRMYASLSEEQRLRLRAILERRGLATEEVERHLDEIEARTPAPKSPPRQIESVLHDRLLDFLDDPRAGWDRIVSDLPAAMFLALPLFAAWLKLMYRGRFYAEHLVFALHLHAFLFIVGIVLVLLPDAAEASASAWRRALQGGSEFAGNVLLLATGVYYVVALKRVYRESWPRTVTKFTIVNAVHVIVIGLGVAVTATASLVL